MLWRVHKTVLNRYCLHFSRKSWKLIISPLCNGEGCCMGVHSMGAPLMSQTCPLFSLRHQTANDYLALGFFVILQHTYTFRQPHDKQVLRTHLNTALLQLCPHLSTLCKVYVWILWVLIVTCSGDGTVYVQPASLCFHVENQRWHEVTDALSYAMCFVNRHLKDVCELPFLSEPAVHLRLKYQHTFTQSPKITLAVCGSRGKARGCHLQENKQDKKI